MAEPGAGSRIALVIFSNPFLLGAIGVSALLQLSVVTIDVLALALIPACTSELAKWAYVRWEAHRDAGPARRVAT